MTDALAQRHRVALKRANSLDLKEWVEGSLQLADVVAEEWTLMPSHPPYSQWLVEKDLPSMHPNEVWALRGMASRPELAREALKQGRRSYRTIWENGLRKGHKLPPVRSVAPKINPLTGLTPEQVDPELAKDPLAFKAKYGQVNLHTKAEVDDNAKQSELQRWLKWTRESASPPPSPDPETLSQWLGKPGKRSKLEKTVTGLETALTFLRASLKAA